MIGLQLLINIEGLTYQEVAEKVGVTRQMVFKWISKEKNISDARLEQLSSLFNVAKEFIINDVSSDKIKAIKMAICNM